MFEKITDLNKFNKLKSKTYKNGRELKLDDEFLFGLYIDKTIYEYHQNKQNEISTNTEISYLRDEYEYNKNEPELKMELIMIHKDDLDQYNELSKFSTNKIKCYILK